MVEISREKEVVTAETEGHLVESDPQFPHEKFFYTAGTNSTRPPVAPVATNINSDNIANI